MDSRLTLWSVLGLCLVAGLLGELAGSHAAEAGATEDGSSSFGPWFALAFVAGGSWHLALAAVLDLPLHDARLDGLTVDWAAGTCTLSLETAAPIHEAAGPHALTFHGVRRVELPHEAPWGDSAQVNGAALEGSTCALEMQSGDTLRIQAGTIAFGPRAATGDGTGRLGGGAVDPSPSPDA